MNIDFILSKIQFKQILALIIGIVVFSGAYLPYRTSLTENRPKLELFNSLSINIINSVKKITDSGSSVSQILKQELDNEFNLLLGKIQQEFPLNSQIWQEALNKLESLKNSDNLITRNPVLKHKPNDNPLIRKVRKLLVSYNIDPKVVTIETMNDPKNASYAFAGQCYVGNKVMHFIKLNLAQLPNQTQPIQEALLRHEIMHLLNYDQLTFFILEKIFKENGITTKEFQRNEAFIMFHKFTEYRADLVACLNSISTAQALQESFIEHTGRYDDSKSRTHPSCEQRYAAVDNLIKYIHAENQLKTA